MKAPVFYLGTHHPTWLWNGQMDGFRLFVSHNRLTGRKSRFPAATVPGWGLDSGAFTFLQQDGECRTSPLEYATWTARYGTEIGGMEWAAGQDHMCEYPVIYGGTFSGQHFAGTRQFIDPDSKLTYEQLCGIHQRLSVENLLALNEAWPQASDDRNPFIPTLQGEVGNPESYLRCAAMYEEAGIHLADYPVVGVGSVCRLQATTAISRLARGLAPLNLNLHWFGLKLAGLPAVWPHITSHDSQAWGVHARRNPRMDGCTHIRVRGKYIGQPSTCANCSRFARQWGREVTALGESLAARGYHYQGELFTDLMEEVA